MPLLLLLCPAFPSPVANMQQSYCKFKLKMPTFRGKQFSSWKKRGNQERGENAQASTTKRIFRWTRKQSKCPQHFGWQGKPFCSSWPLPCTFHAGSSGTSNWSRQCYQHFQLIDWSAYMIVHPHVYYANFSILNSKKKHNKNVWWHFSPRLFECAVMPNANR